MIRRKNAFMRQLILLSSAVTLSTSAIAADLNQTQTLAKKGDVVAQHNLGVMYENGEGVRQDYVKAVDWYAKAANKGLSIAQFNLGAMYYNGKGVPQSYAKAIEL